jgi:CheY-like chemotaxis protein
MASTLQEDLQAPTVLVVDDTPEILSLIHTLLRGTYRVKTATAGRKCLQLVDCND